MKTQNLVRPPAEIVTILTLVKGDVYKRLEPKTTYTAEKVVFGVVTDVLHNGEAAAITAIEFEESYSDVTPALKVFGTDTDMIVFPAAVEEFAEHQRIVLAAQARVVSNAQKTLDNALRLQDVIDRAFGSVGLLTAAATGPIQIET